MLANGSSFEDRYEILGELGRGRFGRVYHARQLSTGQPVAVKVLAAREGADSSSAGREVERFRRETRICAALSHPHLVQLIDSGETGEGRLYAVFAYVPGETLEQALAREGTLGVRESLRLMTQVLEALACAHAKGIVHRDLKPSNLMLSGAAPRRNAVVLDFGVGGVAEDRRRAAWETLTQAGEFVGTPLYASPEQLAGEAATPRSDLYAWGLILLECLTGAPPFSEEGAAARLLTGGGVVELPAWLHEHRLGALLETVTARKAAGRELSTEELVEALDEVGRGELPVAPEGSQTPPPLPEPGERRHLTVMFCDLVGATALSRQLDGEAYSRILRAYHERSEKAIERYDGTVVQREGDGLLVYFGHPQAHDDDPERAVQAGRDIVRDLRTLNSRLEAEHGIRLAVRVGIHTGPAVLVRTGGQEKGETLALGVTPNIAARVTAVADPDTVVISEATRRLAAGRIVTEDLGTPPLKGVAEPLRIHRVVQTLPRPFTPTPATPFVGREQELGLLLDRFAQAQEKRGQSVWIVGEPGIGKTRLVQQLRERLAATSHGWLECRCSPYTRHSALSPVIALVEQALRLDDVDDPAEKVSRVEVALELADFDLTEAVPLFASLLALRLPERYAPLEISAQRQRQKTLEALLAWVLAVGERQPVVLVVEDLQWIDPSTLEWLGLLIEQCPTAGVLVLLTFRPEFEPPWPRRAHLQPIVLARLKDVEARALAVAAVPEHSLLGELIDRIAARSDGVPLFVEELAKSVAEAGRGREGPDAALEIPETLQDSLMARLDRLGEAKGVAQLGASLGREFPYTLLKAVAPLREGALREGLARLVAAELLYQRGLPPQATFIFKHALVQDAAYQSLLESQRRELHGRVADALAEHFPQRVEREPEEIARHCEAAGRTEQAIGHYQRAGQCAMSHFAYAEAAAQLQRAIELLQALPAEIGRDRHELTLQTRLAGAFAITRGVASPEAEQAYLRARQLSEQLGDARELFRSEFGLHEVYFFRSEYDAARELAEDMLRRARETGDPDELVVALWMTGTGSFFRGEFARARAALEEGIGHYGSLGDGDRHYRYTRVDPGIPLLGFAARALLQLGHPDQGLARIREMQELARRTADPFNRVNAALLASMDHIFRQDSRAALEEAEALLALAREHMFQQHLVLGASLRAQALTLAGQPEGISRLRAVLDAMRAAGSETGSSGSLAILARALGQLGRAEEGVAVLAEARSFVARSGEHYHEAEIHRVEGELLLALATPDPAQAEAAFRDALQISRRQGARFAELRAATSLARLLRDRGRRNEARALLRPLYDWFTEGFDTVDLKEARELLEDL